MFSNFSFYCFLLHWRNDFHFISTGLIIFNFFKNVNFAGMIWAVYLKDSQIRGISPNSKFSLFFKLPIVINFMIHCLIFFIMYWKKLNNNNNCCCRYSKQFPLAQVRIIPYGKLGETKKLYFRDVRCTHGFVWAWTHHSKIMTN